MAILGSILTAAYAHALSPALPAGSGPHGNDATGTLAGTLVVATQIGGPAGEALQHAARNSFTAAMHTTSVVTAAILVASAAVAVRILPVRRPGPTEASTEE